MPVTNTEHNKEDDIRRHNLGDFLRSARARVSPSEHGFPSGMRRRTPGLRREELAILCGISTTWYTWIEQGRAVNVSAEVWARLADALLLQRAERNYLFKLAECADPQAVDYMVQALPDGLDNCVNNIVCPAYILDKSWNILAYNQALLRLFGDWLKKPPANLLRFIFLDQQARNLVVDWPKRASRVVAEFRADIAAFTGDAEIQALVADLQAADNQFADWWTSQSVVDREGGLREFNHAIDGLLSFRQFTFRLAMRPDCKLVMLSETGPLGSNLVPNKLQ